ncbi:hypothetical protein T01_16043 [Trichinella spiralis]|uniref:Uncharacterized protein n=1 Tax=Trichinella spiralis TaxID=6334 RepID=A0A0V1BZ81_TRISP|nr:hypothetical protein T01_16043 [Trichinella spiralis]
MFHSILLHLNSKRESRELSEAVLQRLHQLNNTYLAWLSCITILREIFARSIEHRKVKSSKNSVHDGIKPFIGKTYDKSHLSTTCYFAHFDTKLSSISLLAEKFNKIDVINLFLYLEVLGLTSHTLIFSQKKPFSRVRNKYLIIPAGNNISCHPVNYGIIIRNSNELNNFFKVNNFCLA